jgi:hypothetical protein
MKPLSSPIALLALAAAAVIAVASCSTQMVPSNQNVELLLGDPHANPQRYVDLKPGAEGRLRLALAKIKRHNGICEITFLDRANGIPNPHYCDNIDVRLKTDRVIKSAAAKKAAADTSVANDPNLMYRVASPDPSDIADVADLLKPPSN